MSKITIEFNTEKAAFFGTCLENDSESLLKLYETNDSSKNTLSEYFQLNPQMPPIDQHNWSAYVDLCFHMARNSSATPPTQPAQFKGKSKKQNKQYSHQLEEDSQWWNQYNRSVHFGSYWEPALELRVEIYISKITGEYKIIVPKQLVSQGSADMSYVTTDKIPHVGKFPRMIGTRELFLDGIDIITGKVYSLPLEGDEWIRIGNSHSHNTMALGTFSSTDDKAELDDPGWHLLIWGINLKDMTYKITPSIVWKRHRYYFSSDRWGCFANIEHCDTTYHPDCLKFVDENCYRLRKNTQHLLPDKKTKNWKDDLAELEMEYIDVDDLELQRQIEDPFFVQG